eukprot:SAG31_NODE_20579_length_570_cov_1.154989_1_plen_68_part_00
MLLFAATAASPVAMAAPPPPATHAANAATTSTAWLIVIRVFLAVMPTVNDRPESVEYDVRRPGGALT